MKHISSDRSNLCAVKDDKIRQQNKRANSDFILSNDMYNADEKLFLVFQNHKEEIRRTNVQLYYALLNWKDYHIKELIHLIPVE